MSTNSTIIAKYLSNVFHIELSERVRLFETLNTDDKFPEIYSIFVHEYWHYLLNLSTTVRIREFTLWYQLFPILSRLLQVEKNGDVDSTQLTIEDKELLEEIGELYLSYANFGISYESDDDILDFKIVGEITSVELNLTLKGKDVPFKEARVEISVSTVNGVEPGILIVNNDCVEESVANSVEIMIFPNGKKNALIPYHFLLKMSEYFNGYQLSHLEIASIGTLSLLTTNPALSLNQLFKDYREYRKKLSIEESINKLAENVRPLYDQICNTIISDIDDILRVYENRHPAYQALAFIREKIIKAMFFRKKDLLFELSPFKKNSLNFEKLQYLILEVFKSCDVIQLNSGDEHQVMRDEIKSFETENMEIDGQSVPISFLMQLMDCQLNFFRAHWALYTMRSSETSETKCSFYNTCNLQCRLNTPEICEKTPWKTFVRDGEKCVYSHAVSTLMGLTKLKPN